MTDIIEKLEGRAADESLPPEERDRLLRRASNLRVTQKAITEYARNQRAEEERRARLRGSGIKWRGHLLSLGKAILTVASFVLVTFIAIKLSVWLYHI